MGVRVRVGDGEPIGSEQGEAQALIDAMNQAKGHGAVEAREALGQTGEVLPSDLALTEIGYAFTLVELTPRLSTLRLAIQTYFAERYPA
jgi:hypothetical protein